MYEQYFKEVSAYRHCSIPDNSRPVEVEMTQEVAEAVINGLKHLEEGAGPLVEAFVQELQRAMDTC
jgi:hypothetical protein